MTLFWLSVAFAVVVLVAVLLAVDTAVKRWDRRPHNHNTCDWCRQWEAGE